MVKYFKYLILVTAFNILLYPQSEDILQKESELSKIKNEITNLEKELASKSAAQKKSFEAVENLNRQSFLLNKAISEIRTEIKNKDKEIIDIKKKISSIESEIKILQENYAKYVRAIYMKGQYNELESLIDAASFQQAIMRTYYLQVFADHREQDLVKFEFNKKELDESKALLVREKQEKLNMVARKDSERKSLQQKLDEKKKVLKSIEKNKKELSKMITAKKESQQKIEQIIVELIEREASKNNEQLASTENVLADKNKIMDENVGYDYDLSTTSFASFSDLQGKMSWPLRKGKVIRKFGENKHKSLNTVTLNYGIDIKADKDKNVFCVGEGVVAAIDWLPGYGNVVIVSHKNNFRTVYGHLSEIYVLEGERIKTGSVIALVDEGIDGYVLHFEIWNGRDKQNPEKWLGKR